MGFGTVAANIIFFTVALLISTTLAVVFKGYVDSASQSIVVQKDIMENTLKTDITITTVFYDNTTDPSTTYVYLKNTGKTILDISLIDVFVDGLMIPRNTSNRSISIPTDTELINPGLWDPKESLEIAIYKTLESKTHTVAVVTQHGVKDIEGFSN